MTQTLSAADRYAELQEKRFEAFLETTFSEEALKGVELFEVKTPSGMPFKCRKLDVEFAKQAGFMPMALTEMVAMSANNNQSEAAAAFAQMSATEQRAAVQATARIIRYIAVEPRLVLGEVGDNKNAISVDAITVEDFAHLANWAKTGGAEGESLKTFRGKRR